MRGGVRKGAGRKKLPALLKKEKCTIKLPMWLQEKFRDEKVKSGFNRDKLILEAILEKTGWTPPNL